MKLLITSGGTREPIDPVRYLSNGSTGATGAALATVLNERGHEVTLLHGLGAQLPTAAIETESFSSTEDLRSKLAMRLATGNFAAVIMAAAVADYRPAEVFRDKLSSDQEGLTLNLVRNPKLLPKLRGYSPRPLQVIGFKLTVGADAAAREAAVRAQFEQAQVDAVVHNDLEEMAVHPERVFRWFTGPAAHRLVAGIPALADVMEELFQKEQA